jgi:ribose-phosphate pyrophosphokinase
LLPGTGTIGLARRISRHCGIRVGLMECGRYADGERYVYIAQNVLNNDELLLHTLCSPVNSIVEIILALASSVTLVLPYVAYGRQEKHAQGTRATLSARCVASVLSRNLVAMDLHLSKRHVFFDVPTQLLSMRHAFDEYLLPGSARSTARVSPDAGGAMDVVTDTIHHDPRDLGPSARVLASACVRARAIGASLPC